MLHVIFFLTTGGFDFKPGTMFLKQGNFKFFFTRIFFDFMINDNESSSIL